MPLFYLYGFIDTKGMRKTHTVPHPACQDRARAVLGILSPVSTRLFRHNLTTGYHCLPQKKLPLTENYYKLRKFTKLPKIKIKIKTQFLNNSRPIPAFER